MEIRVLRSFLEAAREGNMTRAAERLYLSQPTVSKQIRELEEELGAKLFVRSNYSVRLTEAGMLLKERAEDILSLVDRTEAEFKSLEEVNSGDLYIGAPESEAMGLFAEAMHELREKYPKIRCNIYSGNLTDVCERLDKGLLDLAIVMSWADLSKYGCLRLPMKDTWGVLMRRDDPLTEKETVSVEELKDLPLICSRQWLDQEFPQWFAGSAGGVNIAATYNLAYNAS
nr:LysR family transcriptional regulator [Clostridiales bacterium]